MDMAPFRTYRALVVVGALMCVVAIPSAVHAQSPTSPTAQPATTDSEDGSKLPVSLDRIREGLQRQPKLRIDFLDPSIPLFRTSVHHKGLQLSDYWKFGPDTAVSKSIGAPFASTWHHEFISMTTPDQAIAASPFGLFGNPVHPIGPPVGEITSALKSAFSNMQRGRIRRQIQAELKEIEANKASQALQTPQSEQAQAEKASETAKPKTPPPGVPNDQR
jgi:hypothetical protein